MYTFVNNDAGLSLWRLFSARYSGDHVWRWNATEFSRRVHSSRPMTRHWRWASWSQPLRQANSLAESWQEIMSAHVYHCAKNSSGFPNTCWKSDTITRQMHAFLVLFRPLPNVDIQNFGMWGMYNLAKAYGNIENPFANRRVEDWEASNGHTKDATRRFHGPWHNYAVGENICAQPFRMWRRLCFHTFLQVSQIFQRRKSDANKQIFWK